jgi:hypothetical protein
MHWSTRRPAGAAWGGEAVAATTDLYERLLALNREAFAAGSYEVAYHALAAAMHCAIELEAPELLSDVAQRASEQMTWIDEHVPEHTLSTRSAGQRGNTSVYGLLARQATTHAHMLAHSRGHDG